MAWRSPRFSRSFALLLLPLALYACGGQSTGASKSPAPGGAAAMPLPAWAKSMKVTITSPAPDAKITSNQLPVKVDVSGFKDSCDLAGTKDVQGIGHYHLLLDKSLVDMYCTSDANLSMQNVQPGKHTLSAIPALNDHAEVEDNASSVTFDYEPSQPLPVVTPLAAAGAPSIKIVSPTDGSKVSGAFDVQVQVSGFRVTCDLEGKPDVAGYGHWHANLDTTSGPMMGMMTMLRMSCGNSLHLTSQGISRGKHALIVFLTDNQHAPLTPMVSDQTTVDVA